VVPDISANIDIYTLLYNILQKRQSVTFMAARKKHLAINQVIRGALIPQAKEFHIKDMVLHKPGGYEINQHYPQPPGHPSPFSDPFG
jgi:hypothetical protein